MIATRQYGFRVRDPDPNLTPNRLCRPIKLGSRGWEPKRDLWLRVTGGEGNKKEFGGLSHDSEHDLAVMVSDFMENGSSVGNDSWCSSDSDSGSSDLGHLVDRVLFYKRTMDQYECDLLSIVHSFLLSVNETELLSIKREGLCNASCIRQLLVKHLRVAGYDAAICLAKWLGVDKVPGGDHEYVDVVLNGNNGDPERIIIDLDFHSHFEIARAVDSYDAILKSLPVVYVGPWSKLKQFLQIMVDAAKFSLHQNSMPLPPWRSLAYLQSKWQSKYDRKLNLEKEDSKFNAFSDQKQCIGHLRMLKSSLQSEIETERLLKPITNDKKRMVKSDWRRSSIKFSY